MQRRNFVVLAALGAFVMPGGLRSAMAQDAVRMRELYDKDGSFSDYAETRDGQRVIVQGFMAPPLKAESTFFVLTKMPMAVCPFCESEADWPLDIVSVYSREVISAVPFNVLINVAGVLRLGTYRDEELGFVSRVRLTEAEHWRA